MITIDELKKIKETIEELLQKMTILGFTIDLKSSLIEIKDFNGNKKEADSIEVNLILEEEPQILIGQQGQTLFELSRLLKIVLNKKLQKDFYLNLDINEYKKKKIEYLKELAITTANEVALTKEKKILPPMPAYERRIIHAELSGRQDVATESQGEGVERCVVIIAR